MPTDLTREFWKRIADVRAGMLAAGDSRAVPMSHAAVEKDGALWFITADGTEVADAAKAEAAGEYVIACSTSNLYARINGTLEHVTDAGKLDELWSPVAAAWFEDGKADEDICLVKFSPTEAEVWATDGGAKFLYEIARANLFRNGKPDMGDHGMVTF